MKAPLPSNEVARLTALRQYQILDTASEKAFDDITLLASYVCNAPIAVISLVDADRQWFKSKVGQTVSETSRDISFCSHAILQPDLMVVPDALKDERFATSPLVNSDPKVRFYAGMPLVTPEGHALGTLCVYDRKPRELSPEQADALRALANQVIVLLELRRNSADLARAAIERDRAEEELRKALGEIERRTFQEMELAKKVQSRLFPQRLPPLRTLEYAGNCLQARAVGGDYYDFLDLGTGWLGLVLADIAGKGLSGALLMASLQANLRGHSAIALDDPLRLLRSVNHLFYESTEAGEFASLFFADYQDTSRRLRYANCGHDPPLLLRADGTPERLMATATLVGLFEEWQCSIAEAQLAPGDTLVVYSDGLIEAVNENWEEFGEARLLDTVRAHRDRSPSSLLNAIGSAVQHFSGGEQEDDMTLLVARAR